jgi:hypothetical protein
MNDVPDPGAPEETVREQLERAARDLWSMVQDSGENYVVFLDHRRLRTRVERQEGGGYHVSWETQDGDWVEQDRLFENPREAAFHGYQGPH